jgi:predicted porin
VLGVEYKISDNLKAYASVRQFGLVSDDARAAVKASSAPQAKRDLTIATVGMAVSF